MKLSEVQIFEVLTDGPPAGLSVPQLASRLGLPKAARQELGLLLEDLLRSGRLTRHGRLFAPVEQQTPPDSVVTGVLQVTPGGRGFVDIGEAFEDVMLVAGGLGAALDGDTVEVLTWQGARRTEGEVRRVVSRGRTRITGNLVAASQDGRGGLVFEPDDPRITRPLVLLGAGPGRAGDAALAEITAYPEGPDDPLSVAVTRVLGERGALQVEVARCVARAGIDEELPASVRAAARRIPELASDEAPENRSDLRDVHFVTIDPISARDFDDAVAVDELEGGSLRVWVAVADVSHYIEEGGAIDQEARRRGCSVYLPDRAIHMLPESLSAGICSLVPHQDRLAMVVRFDLGEDGEVFAEECLAAVIHSHGRLDYHGVAAAMQGDFRGLRAGYQEHVALLDRLRRAAAALRKARMSRGSLDLDLPETQVVLDEDDPCRVRNMVLARPDRPIKQAYNVIEELMVAANEVVARRFRDAGMPAIWRIHPAPAADGLQRLVGWLDGYGLSGDPEKLRKEREMSRLLRRIQSHRAAQPLSYLVLRALKQATYSTSNLGHFGLASKAYLHFTSPIRRYPDLQCHRLLKLLLAREGRPSGAPRQVRHRDLRALGAIAAESTARERQSIELEREVHHLYAAALMRDRIGDRSLATVTGITNFGLFVTLDEPAVEGLIRLETLPGRPTFLQDHLRLVDPGQGRVYSLGDRLLVEVIDTSMARRQIDLKLVLDAPGVSHEFDPGADQQVLFRKPARGPKKPGQWPPRGKRGRGRK